MSFITNLPKYHIENYPALYERLAASYHDSLVTWTVADTLNGCLSKIPKRPLRLASVHGALPLRPIAARDI